MSYINRIPIDDTESSIAHIIHIDYCLGKGYNPVHYVPCIGRPCTECYKDETLYRVCPGCGAGLGKLSEMCECPCGTVMWVCFNSTKGPIVTRYATPNKIFLTEEDVI